MHESKQIFGKAQRGVSLTGLIFVLAILGVVAVFLMKLIPIYSEYNAIKNGIRAAKETSGSVRDMQNSFDRNATINDVTAISGRDLIFTKDSGEMEIAFAYEKRVPLVANISLLIDFAATTDRTGAMPEKPASAK